MTRLSCKFLISVLKFSIVIIHLNISILISVLKYSTYRPGVTCYACGEEGHYAKQCPKPRNSTPKLNNGGNNSAPKRNNFNPNNNHRKGHLNHVTKEEAQNAPDIVLDTFLSTQYLQWFSLILELLTLSFRKVLLCKIIFRCFLWRNP